MRFASLLLVAAFPLLSSCASFGVDEVWASPDASGERKWTRFPSGAADLSCVAKYSSGRNDRTITVGLRICGSKGCNIEKVSPPKTDENGNVLTRDANDPGIVALSDYVRSEKGIASVLSVKYSARTADGKPAPLPPGNYECFFVVDGPAGESTASLVGNSANYESYADFVVSK